jgi:ADP-ribosyl-[dinitrogen reductase] hydrolase
MYERQLSCALAAARKVATLLRSDFHAGYLAELDKKFKPEIRLRLMDAFPEYGYRGEETRPNIQPQDAQAHLWLVDPHDGTHAAAKGHRGAAISIALLRKGLPVLGVVFAYLRLAKIPICCGIKHIDLVSYLVFPRIKLVSCCAC